MATYQAFSAPICDTLAHFQAWAQFFGGGFSTIGWLNLNGSGTVNTSGTAVTWVSGTTFQSEWAGGAIVINGNNFTILTVNSSTSITLTATAGTNTGVSYTAGFGILPATGSGSTYTFTNPVLPANALAAQQAMNYVGAWVSGTTYPLGSNAANNAVTLVTDNSSGGNGITYQKITVNVSTNLTTAPHSNSTDWLPCQFEVWKSQGSNTSTFPIYVRIVYTTAGTNAFRIHLSIGNKIDSSGNLINGIPLTATAPITVAQVDNSTTTSMTVREMDFAGDTDNFRFVLWRGDASLFVSTVVVDRARNASGTATDAYFYAGTIFPISGGIILRSSILPNSTIGNGAVAVAAGIGWQGVILMGGLATSYTLFGQNPPIPIFPMIGYVANPLLGAVGFHRSDVTDGSIMPVWMYGASHNYLVNSSANSALQAIDNISSTGTSPAILWE